jgi:hypothetical protein
VSIFFRCLMPWLRPLHWALRAALTFLAVGAVRSHVPPVSGMLMATYMDPPDLQFHHGQWVHKWRHMCEALLPGAFHRIPVDVVGPQLRPKGDRSTHQVGNVGVKVRGWRNYVDGLPDGILLFLADGADVMVLQSPQTLARAARQHNLHASVLFAGERMCWPRTSYCDAATAPTTFRHINTGALVAITGPALRTVLQAWELCAADGWNDQACIQHLSLDSPEARKFRPQRLPIAIDWNCSLFQIVAKTGIWQPGYVNTEYQAVEHGRPWRTDGRIVNPETSSEPMILHFSGEWKKYMRDRFPDLTPNASWADPRLKDYKLRVWGRWVRGADFCQNVLERTQGWR